MELRAVKNIVKTFRQVLDSLEENDKTGTVSFILKWFGLGLRYTLTLAPLLHINIMCIPWEISKRLCTYDDANPSTIHIIIRTIAYFWIPVTTFTLFIYCSVLNNYFIEFEQDIVIYMFWFAWSLCIPILWLVDIISGPKVDFNKSALKILRVKNVKLTVDAVLHNTRDGREFTFLWVTSLIAIFPSFLIGFFSHYIYDEFINLGNSRSLKCQAINTSTNNGQDELDTYNLCLYYFKSYVNDTLMTTEFNNGGLGNTRVCCAVSSLSAGTFLAAVVYFITLFFFSRVFARFIAQFVLRSEQVRHPGKFKSAIKAQLEKIKTSVNTTLFQDRPMNDDGTGGTSKIVRDEDDDISDEEDDFQVNTQSSNLDDLDHDIAKIERKVERRKAKMGKGNGNANTNPMDQGHKKHRLNSEVATEDEESKDDRK